MSNYSELQIHAINAIEHTTDGPCTDFVLIARAIKLAREQGDRFPIVGIDDPIAKARFMCLGLLDD